MMKRILSVLAFGVLPVLGNPIDLSTANNASAWTVSWNDGSQTYTGPGYQVFSTDLSFTSTSFSNGSAVGGGTNFSNWNGVWFASINFQLPSNALNPVLNVNQFWSDDRTVLYLNGVPVADQVVNTGTVISGEGRIYNELTGNNYVDHSYVNTFTYSLPLQNFNIGGQNTLLAITNNVGHQDLNRPAATFQDPQGDRTSFRLSAQVSYTELIEEVPEPGSVALVGLGLIAVACFRKRR